MPPSRPTFSASNTPLKSVSDNDSAMVSHMFVRTSFTESTNPVSSPTGPPPDELKKLDHMSRSF